MNYEGYEFDKEKFYTGILRRYLEKSCDIPPVGFVVIDDFRKKKIIISDLLQQVVSEIGKDGLKNLIERFK